ncbi:MAG: 2-succinyl-5-enolpyruvyl-6-hydroxy-3-cyclohexene-1-carboxylic-acid synthase, partial [Actinomycetota bacterium]|nr:2-succinyl-5-enolpyruvyl-6-hydroxy-3-cyclohexene-1-carboxylic-acid synthase [Actinomycetota bacterium]
RDATTTFAIALVDEWVRAGVTDAVVAPGSRSAPLALALARDTRIRVHVVLDERSAAFRALGIGLGTGRPAVLCCTSGTAAVNFHPAVVEAHHARVPLLVCTADRPPELRDTGAGQTIDQTHLYGTSVRWFVDPRPPTDEPGAGAVWRAIASRAVAETLGSPKGPVHLNLPFREPLLPTGAPLVDAPGRADGRPWTTTVAAPRTADPHALAELVRAHPRGLLVAGWGAHVDATVVARFAAAAGWPVLADAISGVRTGAHAISTYEALLRVPEFADAHRPDLLVRIGAPLTSNVANAWLDTGIPQVLIDPDGVWLDPNRAASVRIVADAEPLLTTVTALLDRPSSDWLTAWRAAEQQARTAIDRVLDTAPEPFEGVVARDLAAALPDGATLVVASSLPVRALEWCMAPRAGLRVLANRGANGIDGFVSTVLGVANDGGPTVGLCGDLCFLHDINGLLGADVAATFVVVDNDGGGIFSFLPQHGLAEFEELFGTPHGLDLVAVARAHGAQGERTADLSTLNEPHEGVRVLVVPVDREKSVAHHRTLWDATTTTIVRR